LQKNSVDANVKSSTGESNPCKYDGFGSANLTGAGMGARDNSADRTMRQYLWVLNERLSFVYFWKSQPDKFKHLWDCCNGRIMV